MQTETEIQTANKPTIELATPFEWTTVDGATPVRVALDPHGDGGGRVYVYNMIGGGTPMAVWHNRHLVLGRAPVEAVPEQLEKALRADDAQDAIRALAARWLGDEWDGSNHVGRWRDHEELDTDCQRFERAFLADVPQYWDAADWFSGNPEEVIKQAIADASIDAAVEREVDQARPDAYLREADAEKALRWLLEKRRDRLDAEKADERTERLTIARLLGETDEEAEAKEREAWLMAALELINVTAAGEVVRVNDGEDVWLCYETEYDAMVDRVRDGVLKLGEPRTEDDEETHAGNYSAACGNVRGPVLSRIGGSRGTLEEQRALLAAALAAELVTEHEADLYAIG